MEDLRINEIEFNDIELQRINENVIKYDFLVDKKEFLRNISCYEQKQILLNTRNPYDVLVYLSEIDTKSTNLVLESLQAYDIYKILDNFTLEQKRKFYQSFPNLNLINKFIKFDNKSSEYMKTLNTDRKVELLKTTTQATAESAEIIYSSISQNERIAISDSINDYETKEIISHIEESTGVSNENPTNSEDIIENPINNEEQQAQQMDEMAEKENVPKEQTEEEFKENLENNNEEKSAIDEIDSQEKFNYENQDVSNVSREIARDILLGQLKKIKSDIEQSKKDIHEELSNINIDDEHSKTI